MADKKNKFTRSNIRKRIEYAFENPFRHFSLTNERAARSEAKKIIEEMTTEGAGRARERIGNEVKRHIGIFVGTGGHVLSGIISDDVKKAKKGIDKIFYSNDYKFPYNKIGDYVDQIEKVKTSMNQWLPAGSEVTKKKKPKKRRLATV